MKFLFTVFEEITFYLIILLLPTQLGKHFWPDFSYLHGIRIDYLSPTLYMTDVLMLFLLLFWVINRLFFNKSSLTFSTVFFIYLAFVLVLLFSALSSPFIETSLYSLFKFLEYSFFFFYIASTVKHMKQLFLIALLLGLAVISEALLAVAQYISHGSLGGIYYLFGERFFTAQTPGIANVSINDSLILRPYGTFSHPNVLAGFLLISLSFILLIRPYLPAFPRWFYPTTLLIGSLSLFLTFSRIAILLWIGMFIYTFFFKQKVDVKKLLIVLIMLGLLGALFYQTPLLQRFIETALTDESVTQRKVLLHTAWNMFIAHPLFGIGWGVFLPTFAETQTQLFIASFIQPVHNIFALLLVELGLLGMAFIGVFLYKTVRHCASSLWLILLLLVALLGSFDHYFLTLQQGQLLLSLVLGLSWSSVKIVKS